MTARVIRIAPQQLDARAFAPFGQIIGPADRPPVTNRDLLARNLIRMPGGVPPERVEEFDILDYWAPVGEISRDTMKLGYLIPRQRPLKVSWFERHLKGTQTFLPLGGRRSLMVVAPPADPFDAPALPRPEDARAFILDGRFGINLRLGTWHWTPFPLEEGAAFAILVREQAAADDLNMVDLVQSCGCTIELVNPAASAAKPLEAVP